MSQLAFRHAPRRPDDKGRNIFLLDPMQEIIPPVFVQAQDQQGIPAFIPAMLASRATLEAMRDKLTAFLNEPDPYAEIRIVLDRKGINMDRIEDAVTIIVSNPAWKQLSPEEAVTLLVTLKPELFGQKAAVTEGQKA